MAKTPFLTPRSDDSDAIWIHGLHAIEAVVRNRSRDVAEVRLVEGRDEAIVRRVEELCRASGTRLSRTTRVDLDRLAGPGHNGLAARVGPRRLDSLDTILESGAPGARLVFFLDSIEDPRNLGAILRSAEAFGAEGVVAVKDRSAPMSGVAVKASAGASESVRFARVPNLRAALESAKRSGFWVYGASVEGRPCSEIDLQRDIALVLGSEGSGLRRLTRSECDGLISVPMSGRTESLNVAAAAAVLGYEVRRQGGASPGGRPDAASRESVPGGSSRQGSDRLKARTSFAE